MRKICFLGMDKETIIHWFIENRRNVLTGTLVAFVALGIGIQRIASKDKDSIASHLVSGAYTDWSKDPDQKNFLHLKKIMKEHPSQEVFFQEKICQRLIAMGKGVEALDMARKSISRTEGSSPFHEVYAKGTLLIENGKYDEALKGTLHLVESIKGNEDFALLRGFSLLRIATLCQKLGDSANEKKAWLELSDCLESSSPLLRQYLSFGDLSASEYIKKEAE